MNEIMNQYPGAVEVRYNGNAISVILQEQERTINVPIKLTKFDIVRLLANEIESAFRSGAAFSVEYQASGPSQRNEDFR